MELSMQWHMEYEIGLEELDAQHEELFTHFDSFIEGVLLQKDSSHILELMDFLDQYTDSHFKQEESLMDRLGFPGAKLHKAQHKLFESEFLKLRSSINKKGPSYPTEMRLAKVITEWWIDHIQKMDKKLGAFILERTPTRQIVG